MINFDIFGKKIGLALSGGGIKSYAQQPIVDFLYSKKIKFNYFGGSSMGSVVATLLAMGLSAEELKESLIRLEKKFQERKILSPNIAAFAMHSLNGFLDGEKLEELLEEEISFRGYTNIEDVPTSLFIVAVDILTSKIVIFTSCKTFKSKNLNTMVVTTGKLSRIVRSSCAIPVLFSSVNIDDLKLMDGGILMAMPVSPLLDAGAKKVISISMLSEKSKSKCESIIDVGIRSFEMVIDASVHLERLKSTININIPLDDISIIDVGKSDVVFNASMNWIIQNKEMLSKQLREKEIL